MQKVFGSTGFEFGFLFVMRTENAINPEAFEPFFSNLPVDPYIEGNYRLRRLSRFKVSRDGIIKMPHGYLFQPKEYNPLVGGIKREFSELDEKLVNFEMFKSLLSVFRDFCDLDLGAEIGVHQIRTTCSLDNFGNPAPEGIHSDGADFVCIYSIDRKNIQGGETHLYKNKTDSAVFNKILYPGDLLLINDRKFFHYTSPIQPVTESDGSRDVFVLTSPSLLMEH
ncbi:2OG-Fe dioxygenase family protein [Methylocaldum sp.]|uniref:2OG-Fe dioxygenase family protein n=1 Tax=Methylocaldum sp. TaxID=1969727 RepID=UPI002D5BC3F6|nr:2OG-Fe dioxygenase family protein [Methylocaldum sp.]HYE36313.1 2OG-Fe dioxygenase family protein [Methylocaldum sp.]